MGLLLFGLVLFVLVVPPLRWLVFKLMGLGFAVGAILGFWQIVFIVSGVN